MNYEQLKNSILQEAIEGILVPQDPNDEPASVLLDKIEKEKVALVKDKKIKPDKNASRIYRTSDGRWFEHFTARKTPDIDITEDVPYDIPESWGFVRLGNIAQLSMGKTPERGNAAFWSNKNFPWVSIADMIPSGITNETKEFVSKAAADKCFRGGISKKGSLLMSFKLTIGRTTILGMDAYHNEAIITIIPHYDKDNLLRNYLFTFLPMLANQGDSKAAIKGKTLNSKSLYNILVPLPNLAEQQRIVEKLETILPKVEEYGKAQDRLDELNVQLPEKLKASILQEAIEGRLVPQNPDDEPVAVLLDKIEKEKAALVKAKKIKPDKNASRIYRTDDGHWMERFFDKKRPEVCIDDEIPFDIPETWEWQRFENICIHNPTVDGEDDDDAAFMPMALINEGLSGTYTYQTKKWKQIKNGFRRFQNGDFAFAKITPCFQNGKSILPHDLPNGIGAGTTELYVVRAYNNSMLIKYIFYFVKSPYFMLEAKFKGTAGQQRVLSNYIEQKLVPIPPLSEQHRIVEKLETILTLINNINTSANESLCEI